MEPSRFEHGCVKFWTSEDTQFWKDSVSILSDTRSPPRTSRYCLLKRISGEESSEAKKLQTIFVLCFSAPASIFWSVWWHNEVKSFGLASEFLDKEERFLERSTDRPADVVWFCSHSQRFALSTEIYWSIVIVWRVTMWLKLAQACVSAQISKMLLNVAPAEKSEKSDNLCLKWFSLNLWSVHGWLLIRWSHSKVGGPVKLSRLISAGVKR